MAREPYRIAYFRRPPHHLDEQCASHIDRFTQHDIKHLRGAPYHPMTHGKIERWHQTTKTAFCPRTTTCPVISKIARFVQNLQSPTLSRKPTKPHRNLTLAYVYFGRGQIILLESNATPSNTDVAHHSKAAYTKISLSLRSINPQIVPKHLKTDSPVCSQVFRRRGDVNSHRAAHLGPVLGLFPEVEVDVWAL